MLRSTATTLAAVAFTLATPAQITVTNSVFPVIGDTLDYADGNQPNAINVVFTPPGGDQFWDLSGLVAFSNVQFVHRPATSGTGWTLFPEATQLVVREEASPGQDYLITTATAVELVGSHAVDPLQLGSPLDIRYSPPIAQRWAPLNFFDIRQGSSGALVKFLPSAMPAGWNDEVPGIDTMRLRYAMNEIAVVDAWGTITIPGGTYPVLREKRTRYTTTLLDARIAPLGWLDVTDIALAQFGLAALGADTTVTYHFVNDVSKETIAVCTLNASENEVVGVRYKRADLSTGGVDPTTTAAAVRAYPNPTTDALYLEGYHGSTAPQVLDPLGRHHRVPSERIGSGWRLHLDALAPGGYVVVVLGGSARVVVE